MNGLKAFVDWFVDSGITSQTAESEIKYLRFFNATLVLFGLAQLPVLSLIGVLNLWTQLGVNVFALGLCGLGFVLNRRGLHLPAKVLVLAVVIANTAYFAVIMGSSAPVHFWLIPMAVLGVFVFTPAERAPMAMLVGCSMLCFLTLELTYLDLAPHVHHLENPETAQTAAQGSTIAALFLTLILVGMMHRRFAQSEALLSSEKAQSERLLRAILPSKIAKELGETGTTQAVRHEDVSILFADIVGFTPLAASMPAEDVVAILAAIFERFDRLIEECGVEKIKTIGDAYMVAGGVPESSPDHAERLARCALGMLDVIETLSEESEYALQLRIGLHRGAAVAGVIGTTKFAYDLWGESVNLASRLESSGEPGRIHVSHAFRLSLDDIFAFEQRGDVKLKGVGVTRTHWLARG